MDCAREPFIERSKYYESDKSNQSCEVLHRFNILCNRQPFDDPFAVHVYYHNFCHIKYTINLTGKSDTNHNKKECKTKCLIDEVLEKFDGTLNIYIIR